MSDSVRPHRQKPIRLLCPWDSPGKNTGVGYHFLLQCMKVKTESEVSQSCPTLSNPMESLPGFSIHGIFQARVLEWVAIAFSEPANRYLFNSLQHARSQPVSALGEQACGESLLQEPLSGSPSASTPPSLLCIFSLPLLGVSVKRKKKRKKTASSPGPVTRLVRLKPLP